MFTPRRGGMPAGSSGIPSGNRPPGRAWRVSSASAHFPSFRRPPVTPTPIVHGVPASPFVSKVLALLEEKGLAYESRSLVTQPKTPELLARNPLGKIPILEHGGFFLPDSSVICAYLERLHPEPSLYPKDARELGLALFLEEYS